MTGRVIAVMSMRVGIVMVPVTVLRSARWKDVRRRAGIRMTERHTAVMHTAVDTVTVPAYRLGMQVRAEGDAEGITDIIEQWKCSVNRADRFAGQDICCIRVTLE